MRLSVGISSVVFAIGVLASHATGRLYPFLPTGMVLALGLLVFSLFHRKSVSPRLVPPYLAYIVVLSVVYRTYIFTFPESMVGYDPGLFAHQSQLMMNAGSLNGIDPNSLSFYPKAPLFLILIGVFGQFAGLPAKEAMGIYPIVVGTLYPSVVFVLASWLAPRDRRRIGCIAATVAVTGTLSLRYGFWPLPQTLGVMLWLTFLILTMRYYVRHDLRDFLILLLLLLASAYTHKFPVIVIVGTLVLVLILEFTVRDPAGSRSTKRGRTAFSLLLLAGTVVTFQWLFQTDLIYTVVQRVTAALYVVSHLGERIASLFGGGSSGAGGYVGATAINPLLVYLLMNLYGVGLYPLSGFQWLSAFRNQRTDPAVRVLLASASFVVLLMGFGYVIPTVLNPRRFTFFAEVLLISLAVAAVARLLPTDAVKSVPWRKVLASSLLVCLLALQAFSAPALPDHPTTSRDYFTVQEMSGKEFAADYVDGDVYTDRLFAVRPPANPSRVGPSDKYRPISEELVQRAEVLYSHGYVLYRKDVNVYWLAGSALRLTWNPKQGLNRRYNRVYSNAEVTVYANSSSWSNSSQSI